MRHFYPDGDDYRAAIACLCYICGCTHVRETDLSFMIFLTFGTDRYNECLTTTDVLVKDIDVLIRIAGRFANYEEEAFALRLILNNITQETEDQLGVLRGARLWEALYDFARGDLLPR